MVLKPLNNDDIEVSGSDECGFFSPFYQDFKLRFARLLEAESSFSKMEYKLAMSVLDPKINYRESELDPTLSTSDECWKALSYNLSPHDMKRLKAYTDNLADFRMVLDIVPILARLYFLGKLPITLSHVQASVLLCIGLQHQGVSHVVEQMKLERTQILSLSIKVMKKFHKYLYGIASKEIESTLRRLKERVLEPHSISLDDDLNEAAKQVEDQMKMKTEEGLSNLEFLGEYAIPDEVGNDLQNGGGKIGPGSIISVKSSKIKAEKRSKKEKQKGKKRRKDDSNSKSSKKGIS